jgi:ketosteroid isomerase-like protein
MSRTPREVAEEAHRLISAGGTLNSLFAEDGVLTWPFLIPSMPAEIRGRDAIRSHFESLKVVRDQLKVEAVDAKIRQTDDPEVVMLELVQRGQSSITNSPYQLTSLGVITVRDGEIVRFEDYVNPICVVAVAGRQEELAAALVRRPTPEWAVAR